MRAVAVGLLAVALAGALGASILYSEPRARGFGEIDFKTLSATFLGPGDSVTQPLEVQAPDLTRVSFLYSYQGRGEELVQVTVRSSGTVVADQELALPPSLRDQDPLAWWVGGYWDSGARFQAVPIRGRAGERVLVTIRVGPAAQPLALWRSSSSTGGRLAIRTEYGPVRPAIEKAPAFAGRVARYGAPWLPPPVLWLLAALLGAVTACLVWTLASRSPDGDA